MDDEPGGKFKQVSLGEYAGCGVKENGKVDCWGDDSTEIPDVPNALD